MRRVTRAATAVLAALVTVATLAPFLLDMPATKATRSDQRALAFVVPLSPAQSIQRRTAPDSPPQARPRHTEALRSRLPSTSNRATIPDAEDATARLTEPRPVHEASQPAAAAQEQPASAPLRIDTHVIREASRAGKSDARRMADASAAYFGDTRATEQEQLAASIAKTGKPACIRPGGSLLSIFVIAYEVVNEKCR